MEEILEKYAKVPKQQRYAAIVGVLIVTIGGYYWLMHRPKVQHLQERQQKYEQLEKERLEKQAYIDNLAKYQARLNELQDELDGARAKLPDATEVPQLLAQLDNKGRQAGLDIVKFEPKDAGKRDFYEELNFNLLVRGSYHEIASFVDSVGKLDRIVNVNSISLTKPQTKNKKIVLSSDINVRTFRFLEKAGKKK